MTIKKPTRIAASLGCIALALGASQAGAATTYSVPMEFTLNLTAPVCSLIVGGITADVTTPVQTNKAVVNLTPTPLAVLAWPVGILQNLQGVSPFSTEAPGRWINTTFAINYRKVDNMPTASATCTLGTP